MGEGNVEKFSESMGRSVGEGIVAGLSKFALWALIVISVVSSLWNAFGLGLDDSDLSAWKRSGFTVRTDALTGRQYLESSKGFLTPRIGVDGQQVVVVQR